MFGAINKSHMQKGSIKKPLIIGIGATVAVIVVVVIIVTAQCSAAVSGAKLVIEDFMVAAAANNTGAAYACWSTQAATEEEVTALIEDHYNVFAGYESLKISGWSVESSGGITTCDASGTATYTGGSSLPLEASLVKQNDVWKITGISIGY